MAPFEVTADFGGMGQLTNAGGTPLARFLLISSQCYCRKGEGWWGMVGIGTGGGWADVSCGSIRSGQEMMGQQWWAGGGPGLVGCPARVVARYGNHKRASLRLAVSVCRETKTDVHTSWTEPTNYEQLGARGEEKSRPKDV